MRRAFRILCLVSLMVLFAVPLSAQWWKLRKSPPKLKPNETELRKLPTKTEQLASVPTLAAEQPCENWAFAAGIEIMLAAQNAGIKQDYWILKNNGGALCLSQLASPLNLPKIFDGEQRLSDGRLVKLALNYHSGPPQSLDPLILGVRSGIPFMITWRGHSYLVYGVTYDEYVNPLGERLFEMVEMKMVDLYEPADSKQRLVSFLKAEHDPNTIDAVVTISATEVKSTDWLNPGKDWNKQ